MNESERMEQLQTLDDNLLKGAVILSEWCSHIIYQADLAFIGGAYLGAILVAVSAVETYLHAEYPEGGNARLVDLVERAGLHSTLKEDLHKLRRYRNRWVHVSEPWKDEALLARPEAVSQELEQMALFAIHTLRRTIYENQWI
jgi:hypothetical protein